MSPKLKPLLLPQIVERKKQEEAEAAARLAAAADTTTTNDLAQIYYTTNSSSSDVASPLTPTFSARGHLRYSSSTSSLELPPSCTESPASPSQTAHSVKSAKSQLPDVEEEPSDRDETEMQVPDGLYDCLCDVACTHNNHSSPDVIDDAFPPEIDFDYDVGFLSDSDVHDSSRQLKSPHHDSTISGIATRFGSRFHSLSRWRTSRKPSLTAHSVSELAINQPALESCPTSSRSSSISSPVRPGPEKALEPPLPVSSDPSFWESSESLNIPACLDVEKANAVAKSLERDRATATTPLLPPLITDAINEPVQQQSPLQSPTIEAMPPLDTTQQAPPQPKVLSHAPTPSLSKRPSVASFRPSPTTADIPIPFPNITDDAWSDRLGHANFTITPHPYHPEIFTLDALLKLRADWDAARVNFTKHIVRTGENYGETSKIYGLTEEKWAEVEKTWKTIHDETMDKILALSAVPQQQHPQKTSSARSRSRGRGRMRSGSTSAANTRSPTDDVFAGMEWKRLEDTMPSVIPRMLDESKFPARGDEDIVGPMVRDAVMARTQSEERRGSRLWKNLIGKVGLRR